jgi:hypothetical protein
MIMNAGSGGTTMTEEEHQARAAIMGMRYHNGNGFPFYYVVGDDGVPDWLSFIDVDTLEPIITKEANEDLGSARYKADKKVQDAMGMGFWPPIEGRPVRRRK